MINDLQKTFIFNFSKSKLSKLCGNIAGSLVEADKFTAQIRLTWNYLLWYLWQITLQLYWCS